jgi:hypothetical protein
MYRRDEVLALGGYDEATGPSEDKDLWRRLALRRYEARIVQEPLVLYRIHDRQLSRTRTTRQRRLDAESQDRFLAQLAPSAPVSAVRQLLAGDPDAWDHEPHRMLRGVDDVLAGARTRIDLDDDEARRLAERIAARLLEVANLQPWRASTRIVAAEAIARLPQPRRAAARRRRGAAFVRAPARTTLSRLARLASEAGKALPLVGDLHAWAMKSPLARSLYSRAIGSR